MSYLLLPRLTTSYPVAPLSTRSYVVSYCQSSLSYLILLHPTSYTVSYCPTLLLLRFYPVLPHPTTSYHILPCLTFVYPILRCILLPSYTGFHPVLPYPTTSNHILPCRTFLPNPTVYPTAILPHIQPSPNSSYIPHITTSYLVLQ